MTGRLRPAWIAAAWLLAAAQPPAEPGAAIRLNQLGLLPDGPKRAILADPAPTPLEWRLTDSGGSVVASGRTLVFGADRWSGEHVHRIDFGSFRRPGSGYRLSAGRAESRPFAISGDAFDHLAPAALNYFYHNRAGVAIEARLAGGAQWARPAGHPTERATCISGRDRHGNRWPGCSYSLDVTGGWYDAGDHGKYVVNGGIAVWTLMNLWERLPASAPVGAGIDRKALFDEARWEMEFLLRMQVPDGTHLQVPLDVERGAPGLVFRDIDASGMAHHKVADEHWTALPTAPHLDREKRVLFPPSTGATLNLAATAARCARLWREVDPSLAGRCLAAAERAWAAAGRNPRVFAVADFTGSGGYGDSDFTDEFLWAAAELSVTTGKRDYVEAAASSPLLSASPAPEPGWNRTAALGLMTLATSTRDLPGRVRITARRAILAAAETYLADRERTGYAVPYAPAKGYPWGSSGAILNRAILLALAHDLTGDARYRDAVVDSLDFILGRNPLDRSFVSGFGARPMARPHHRFWAHQFDPTYPLPPPGALSGGPNDTAPADEVARAMKGKCAPQTCWADDSRAFSLNEVAINWNAPLVWVASWIGESASAPEIAVTVDDLPVHGPLPPGETPLGIANGVIAALSHAGIPSPYGFVNGRWTERQPETAAVLDAWRDAGFPLGNHGWSHRNLNDTTAAEYETEIAKNEPLLERLSPRGDWRWFRYPFLAEGDDAAKRAAVRATLARRGYRIAAVTMDFGDWQFTAPYARCKAAGDEAAIATMEQAYLSAARESILYYRTLSRSLYGRDIPYVLLIHIGAFDARMLPRLLALYREAGFRFVTLEEAQRDPVYEADSNHSAAARPATLEGRAAEGGIALPRRTDYAPMLEAMCIPANPRP